jgi:hypothetical protein
VDGRQVVILRRATSNLSKAVGAEQCAGIVVVEFEISGGAMLRRLPRRPWNIAFPPSGLTFVVRHCARPDRFFVRSSPLEPVGQAVPIREEPRNESEQPAAAQRERTSKLDASK